MKKTFVRFIIFAYLAVLLVGIMSIGAGAASSYETFTYSETGNIQNSPNAYEVYALYDASRMKLTERYRSTYIDRRTKYEIEENGKSESDATTAATNAWDKTELNALNQPTAIRSDKEGRLYIADSKNNRIIVLKNDYTVLTVIDYFYSSRSDNDTFSEPKGVFVNDDYIYVSDTKNQRIVILNKQAVLNGKNDHTAFYKVILKPDTPLVKPDQWNPSACAVDQYGRIFVVSETATMGIIVLADDDGFFNGYIGAQKVTYNPFELFWRRFQSEEQQKKNVKFVSVTFNNITIDEDGFIYITTDNIDLGKQTAAINKKSADYSPVKKLNSAGNHILKRNGFQDCGGEVYLHIAGDESNAKPSKVTDVAVGPEGSWSIVDYNRGRVFTYNSNGELLFAFGDGGDGSGSTGKLGSLTHLQSMTYQLAPNQKDGAGSEGILYEYNMVLLDNFTGLFTVFTRTQYGDLLMEALAQENNREYHNAAEYWQRILQRNSNFDTAYIGLGKAYYRMGGEKNYREAQKNFKASYETTYYSKAYAELRKNWINNPWHLALIVLVVVVFLVVVVKGLGAAKKFNTRVSLKPGKKTYWEELIFPFHLVFHPFDGFWDLKHEKRGSVRGGLTIMGLTILAFYYNSVGKGYIFNPRQSTSSIVIHIISVVLPVFLWVTANWCLTTLFDGEGSYRDVLVATTYSLAPLPPLLVLSTLLTNVLTKTEGTIATKMIPIIAYVWVGFLLFFGMLVTHGYSLPKNIITTLGTIVALAVLVFVAVLFSSLVGKMIQFVSNIVIEVSSRT